MPTWILFTIGGILVYVAICLFLSNWFEDIDPDDKTPLNILAMIFYIPILVVFFTKDALVEWIKKKRERKVEKKRAIKKPPIEAPYKLSESTIRRIEREGITYRDKH